jgi:predicted TPR repeat methyltransferase
MRTGRPYEQFARVYDLMGADHHSAEMVEYTLRLMRRFRIRSRRGLDLCCGTGTAVSLFREQGFAFDGLDQSAAMLAIAAKKLRGKGARLHQKSLPNFKILSSDGMGVQQYDLVTSYYDALNYLTNAADLQAAFRSVSNHLCEGGWFIFDMNTPEALKSVWGEQVFAGTKENLAWIWQNEYHPHNTSAVCHTTFFVKKGNHWVRFDEEHVERGYPNVKIKRWLQDD